MLVRRINKKTLCPHTEVSMDRQTALREALDPSLSPLSREERSAHIINRQSKGCAISNTHSRPLPLSPLSITREESLPLGQPGIPLHSILPYLFGSDGEERNKWPNMAELPARSLPLGVPPMSLPCAVHTVAHFHYVCVSRGGSHMCI